MQIHIIPTSEKSYEMEKTLDLYQGDLYNGKAAKAGSIKISIPGTTDKITLYPEDVHSDSLGLKISKIFVYQWYEENTSVPSWITYSAKPGGKYDIEFDFKTGNKDITLMQAQDIAFVDGNSSTG